MNWLNTTAILAAAYVAVFLEAHLGGLRWMLGAQIDFLPSLMAYAALTSGLSTVVVLAVCGGAWFDALSANPLGTTALPLYMAGALIHYHRGLILREQWVARFAIALGACAVVPLFSVVLLLSMGEEPLLGYGSLWQWMVMAVGGCAVTPIWYVLLDGLNRALSYPVRVEPGFRPDRDIKRGH
jgi:cell shape-determining protein MreD